MTRKIFRSILTAVMGVLLACLVIIMGVMYEYFTGVEETQLQGNLELAVQGVEQNGTDYLDALDAASYRITLVSPDGGVLYDTQSAPESMENHADREEIREALETGVGESSRYSTTLMERTFYRAVLLSDGTVLRISVNQATVLMLVLGMLQPIAIVLLLALILSAVLASRMAKRIVNPLNELDLDHPLDNNAYEELSPLLGRISQQHRQIDAQLLALQRKNDEFAQITAFMNEGLVLLDGGGSILSINPAAQTLFGVERSCIGKDFLTIERSHDMSAAVRSALRTGHGTLRAERGGREYQFDISRIESEGAVLGAVLLAFDITDQAFAERNRQEFTANVSHELKTPLQSIMGSAELIENGLVKAEDMPRFIGRIRSEATRLLSLIEDIIRLSQLDEGDEMLWESVDLYSLAAETVERLQGAADAKRVCLSLEGQPVSLNGVRRLLSEILYNLCDNAIKYNTEGGSVTVAIGTDDGTPYLAVRDTGIGIPAEHQARVFERFYRVDKSHSRQSGGTGLGLSIVKHAVAYHHAKLDLQSEPGRGTSITVTFPG